MSLDTLTIPQVAELINVKDIQCAKKWLKEHGIKIHKFSKAPFVYAIEVASELDKPYVINLRNQFPDKWKERYRDVVKDFAVFNLLVSKLEDQPTPTPSVRAKSINKKDEERYKRLLG
jgi:deoxyribodipyrimidine photolyase